jgi:hypothetical protein
VLLRSENVQKLSQDNMPTDPDSIPEEWAEEEVRQLECLGMGEVY